YAAHLSPTLTDLNFDLAQFKERVNSELVGNLANFCYRVLSFAEKNFAGKIEGFHHDSVVDHLVDLRHLSDSVTENYEMMNFKDALHGILAISSFGNKYFQEKEPWKLIKTDPEKALEIISFCVMIIKNLSIMIAPILPRFSHDLQKQLGMSVGQLVWNDISFASQKHTLHSVLPLVQKLENEHEKLIIIGQSIKKKEEKGGQATTLEFPLLLKVGKILSVEDHPNAEKLFVEKIDLGNDDIRTIVSGIKQWYKKEDLVGKHVIVVANVKPAKLRGVMSEGMILAAEHEGNLKVLEAPKSKQGDIVFRDNAETDEKKQDHVTKQIQTQIQYEDFTKCSLVVEKHHVLADGKKLKTEHEEIKVNMPDGTKIK
ncbi:MAG: class I tRNA ligase family protein, partial [Nanoarchaeota archaeon]